MELERVPGLSQIFEHLTSNYNLLEPDAFNNKHSLLQMVETTKMLGIWILVTEVI